MTQNRNSQTRPPEPQEPHKVVGVMSLFRTPNMRLKTILITFNWYPKSHSILQGPNFIDPR